MKVTPARKRTIKLIRKGIYNLLSFLKVLRTGFCESSSAGTSHVPKTEELGTGEDDGELDAAFIVAGVIVCFATLGVGTAVLKVEPI